MSRSSLMIHSTVLSAQGALTSSYIEAVALGFASNASTPNGKPIRTYAEILAEIHSKAPNAQIYIGGYPHLFGAYTFNNPVSAMRDRNGSCTVGRANIHLGFYSKTVDVKYDLFVQQYIDRLVDLWSTRR